MPSVEFFSSVPMMVGHRPRAVPTASQMQALLTLALPSETMHADGAGGIGTDLARGKEKRPKDSPFKQLLAVAVSRSTARENDDDDGDDDDVDDDDDDDDDTMVVLDVGSPRRSRLRVGEMHLFVVLSLALCGVGISELVFAAWRSGAMARSGVAGRQTAGRKKKGKQKRGEKNVLPSTRVSARPPRVFR